MAWLNGNGSKARAGDAALTAPPTITLAPEGPTGQFHTDIRNGSTPSTELVLSQGGEVSHFLPVMSIEQAIARHEVIVQAMQRLMKEGVDYGRIPGSPKPALLQPGAQKLANLFGLTLKYSFEEKIEDWSGKNHDGEPFFYYQIKAQTFRGEFLLAEGIGSCNSREAKYRWRQSERQCPSCGKPNIRKSKEAGWYCWRKTGGCGAVFDDNDPAITEQTVGRIPNPDIADQVNTILKIAYKRCMISGVINATSASEFFTQDVEDFSVDDPIDTGGHPTGTAAAAQHVAQEKIRGAVPINRTISWKSMREMADAFKQMRERVGETAWLSELERWGWRSFQDMRNAVDNKAPNVKENVAECYRHLLAIAEKGGN